MIILARLADLLALVGFGLGLWRWRGLDRSRRFLVGFLGVSAACGILQAAFRSIGLTTAWVGNVWDLAVLLLLVPACLMVMRSGPREPFRHIQILAVAGWVWINIVQGGIPNYNDIASMGFYALLGLIGAVLFSQFIEDPLKPMSKPAFILALVALAAGSMDAIASLALSHYEALHHGLLVGLMMTRNAVWCGAYALLAYSLRLDRRHCESKPTFHRRRADLQRNSPSPRDRQHSIGGPDFKPREAL